MSNSYIVEPDEGDTKKDDTLILMVNDNGIISVDQNTLQNLILNQSNATVSVVRLGQTDNDNAEGNITLTVDPPSFLSTETNATSTDSTVLVDPFMEMDSEQLERLETALQSEEAKHILGENVTAMLDMLTVEEQQNSIRYNIELDHCYTSRFSPCQLKHTNPLPDMNLSDVDESICMDINKTLTHTPVPLTVSSNSTNNNDSIIRTKQKVNSIAPKLLKQPISVSNRPRRTSSAIQSVATTPKPTLNINTHTVLYSQQENKFQTKVDEEVDDDELFSLSDSSEPEESDSDSDFGPRSSRRSARARGGRRGLTTRGGSMIYSRKRGSNKQMDSEQVRRLDLEMAAAVSAMKSPEKEEKFEKHTLGKCKKQLKTISIKKKDDTSVPLVSISESLPLDTNVLQTTNQVKANLISANMFKGDMILTKPGQDRNNQKVISIQKQLINSPDIKSMKKQMMSSKNKLISQISKDVNTSSTSIMLKESIQTGQQSSVQQHIMPIQKEEKLNQSSVHQQNIGLTMVTKAVSMEVKKEKKKIDLISDTSIKMVVEPLKSVETKTHTPIISKKMVKKENRKSDIFVTDALGPALFSTPDIIRRVGLSNETKVSENIVTITSAITSNTTNTNINTSVTTTVTNVSMMSTPLSATILLSEPMETNMSVNSTVNDTLATNSDTLILSETLDNVKIGNKASIVELLHSGLDNKTNSPSSMETPTVEHNSRHVSESGIEGDDHLLVTLGMEATKQLPNDEELLAEALLLQETLGVDLENSELVDATTEMSESILSSSLMESSSSNLESPIKTQLTSTAIKSPPHTPLISMESIPTKDLSEPIQIIRGGRVITLPPIEAPATRSKRLQAKTEKHAIRFENKQQVHQDQQQSKGEPSTIKTERILRTPTHISLRKQDMIYDIEDNDDEGEEANSDSEDDPNRLWCICRQPHNNRFMICCDICQDWFHGKCVHVTKAMGEQMENQGIEWVCPNCSKKKNDENKQKLIPRRQKTNIDEIICDKDEIQSSSSNLTMNNDKIYSNTAKSLNTLSSVTHCVVCKKEARKSSIYCSDACILAHAEVTSTKDKLPATLQVKTSKSETPKFKSDVRIIVFNKKTGKVLTGTDAPMAWNLKTWLKEHPSYEVVKSNNLNTIQLGGKTVAAIKSQGIKTNKQLQGSKTSGHIQMMCSKLADSKQTTLGLSSKKTILLGDTPSTHPSDSSQNSSKLFATVTLSKPVTVHPKQEFIKNTIQQQDEQLLQLQTHHHQQISQKLVEMSTCKLSSTKKSHENKTLMIHNKQQNQPQKEQATTKTSSPKKTEMEPIRLNVRKTLTDLLSTRIKEANDLHLKEETIMELALQIELEMFKFFKDTGAKYKAKYRSLVFNIKDTKNLTLFRKIADGSLSPDAVVKLSPEEMASQELAEWREKENKHQLEMIKKNELDLMAQAKSIVVKTHKGEQIIENDDSIEHIDLKTPVQDIVTALNSGDTVNSIVEKEKLNEEIQKPKIVEEDDKTKKEKENARDREMRHARSLERSKNKSNSKRDRSSSKNKYRWYSRDGNRERSRDRKLKKENRHKDRDREHNKSKDKVHHKSKDRDKKKGKNKEKNKKEKHKQSYGNSKTYSKNRNKEQKDKKIQNEDKKAVTKVESLAIDTNTKSIEDRLWRHIEDETTTTNTLDGNDSDISDREPTSTVTIKTPDLNEEPEKEFADLRGSEDLKEQTVWRGFVYMPDVAKFFVTAQNVSGNAKELMEDLPDSFDVVGRINPLTVWDYIGKMKKNATKEILIIRLTATNDEEKIPYITLYSYLNSRNRLGVLGSISPNIKDFYIMPFSNGSKLPSVLLPLDGPGLEDDHQHLLLGIVVHSRKKRPVNTLPVLTSIPIKSAKKEQQTNDRSYTPPPITQLLLATNITDENITPLCSPKSLAQIRTVTQETKQTLSVISKIVPELSSKITFESSSSSDKMQLDDDDEPYSPGEPVDITLDHEDVLVSPSRIKVSNRLVADTTNQSLSPIKNSSELQRKMEELSRQIEEEKQQIQNISSSFLNDASTTLPGLGLDSTDSDNVIEAYSPTDVRSFTPPPQGIKLVQPILEKVSNITIPPNLQEILANVKRQENSKVDSYLPSKPSATFLTTVGSAIYQNQEKYSPKYTKKSFTNRSEIQFSSKKEAKSTLSSLSDYDIMKKAEEELAALAAASLTTIPSHSNVKPPLTSPACSDPLAAASSCDVPHR